MNERQASQLAFQKGNENIVVGNIEKLPLTIEELKSINNNSSHVLETFDSGLTAVVYHLEVDGKHYNLKMKRPVSLVKNVDGQTSFLNEVQRRRDFEELRKRNQIIDKGIVKTIYANYREGIMLSEWVEGSLIDNVVEEVVKQLFTLTLEMEKNGIMEWDLCKGNMLVSLEGDLKLFDFGYAYRYDPKHAFNSEGLELPMFNNVERFETRFFMPYLLELETKKPEEVLPTYKMVKEQAVSTFKSKEKWLTEIEADPLLLDVCRKQIKLWENSLQSKKNLEDLYKLESMRSYVLDIHDDISGKSCTPSTILKVDKVINMINEDYDFLLNHDGLMFDDKEKSKTELIEKYQKDRKKVIEYQINFS